MQGGYLGFAILAFSSVDQAALFVQKCNGLAVGDEGDFIMRLKPANAAAKRATRRIAPGQDPQIICLLYTSDAADE